MDPLSRLVAIEEIRSLAIRYCHFRDQLQLDEMADLFEEDAIYEFGELFGGTVVGRPSIREEFERSRQIGDGLPFATLHTISTHWVEMLDEQTAEGRCFLTDFVFGTEENPLKALVIYDDVYAFTNGAWKFRKRTLHAIWPQRNAAVRVLGKT
ncbi:nuclear transport factor 2 family protein [Celeribacter indicus]|uniref:SnoaL-like domain-containing protein n=1 Tax=Celeribacter indicus TaxID=1208324 RepID=A0A0B5DXY3_9RHOB|nr:nuclear transport factor 2 family protein [Celeribacter indicus]AJE47854.1 hypothetical protein P73_3139 [Celeribacter indicus]SDW25019.1 SnoaL-like domain-containing protein [Celeribacter indicus]